MRSLLVLVVLALAAAACTRSADPAPDDVSTTASSSASDSPDETASPDAGATEDEDAVHVPDEAVLEQLGWLLSVLNGAEIDEAEFEGRFAEVFRDQIGFEAFLAPLEQVRAAGPFSQGALRGGQAGTTVALLDTPAGAGQLAVTIGVEADGTISTLFLGPGEPPTLEDRPVSVGEGIDRLRSFGELALATARVEGSQCRVLTDVGAADAAPIGSAFKLYVLGAVADAVAASALAWDEELTLTAEDISLPSGALQDRPVGTTVTVEEAAGLMISISDNTATDLLIRTLGRSSVEAALSAYGHAEPSLNIPFLTTLEAFVLKQDEVAGDAWVAGGEQARRAVLEDIADVRAAEVDVTGFLGDPVRPDEIEWFASPLDLCRVLAALVERAAEPGLEPLLNILTRNPGVAADDDLWDLIAFKGGSEPGLLTLAWLVEAPDGQRRFVGGSLLDTAMPIRNAEEAALLFAAVRDLLAD